MLKIIKNFFPFKNKLCYNGNKYNTDKGEKRMPADFNALDIARYTIDKCTKENNPISNLQLQKILYYIQRDWINQFKYPLFKEDICAWKFGPVVPEIYYNFCGYGGSRISNQYPDISLPGEVTDFINPIIEEKSHKYPWDLVSDTHRENGAWYTIYQNGKGDHDIIPLDLIRKDFTL